jgi:hypothetical protein
MIVKLYIEKNLKTINKLYIRSNNTQEGLLYSKLAILELCGWIEVSMDDIALRTAKRLVNDTNNQKLFEKEIVKRIYGFDYEQHFRRMLMAVIGLKGVEEMEGALNQSLFLPMCGALSALKQYRDKQAHEYIKGTTLRLDAPSLTLTRFYTVYKGLINIEKVLKLIK